ncbi:kelch-like protein 23 [Cydia amplana]|uniref:kelch-like protein 23 n=1 Tax=Cydia amplana TaxID=1869771 RepID=UPI002FE64830
MPMNLAIKQKELGSFLKLRCMISILEEENEVHSEEFTVNELATVRFKFYTKDSQSALLAFVTAQKHVKAKDDKVKLKFSCHEFDKPLYSEWFCRERKDTRKIGEILHCDISLKDVRTFLLNITITAHKVQDCLLVKLYNDVEFTDFNLGSENGSVAVHRAHMAAHSNVFKAMLSREWKETTEGKVQIKGVTLQTLQHLKQYMYLGTLPEEGLQPLLLIASYYLIEDLKAECISTLAQTAKHGDWYSLFEFATENNIPELLCAITLVNPDSVLEGNTQMVKK